MKKNYQVISRQKRRRSLKTCPGARGKFGRARSSARGILSLSSNSDCSGAFAKARPRIVGWGDTGVLSSPVSWQSVFLGHEAVILFLGRRAHPSKPSVFRS